jgi:cystathionine beta-synthase
MPVVILPDSGSRYLSKFYDDKWMREFGFLSMEFGETALGDLLIAKPNKAVDHGDNLGDSIRKVVSVMHQHAVSQMPVVGEDGALVGLIEEVDSAQSHARRS